MLHSIPIDLLIDIGNTNLKWCLLKAGRLEFTHTNIADLKNIETLYKAWIDIPKPRNILISNVNTRTIEQILTQLITKLWDHKPQILRSQQHKLGLTLAYVNPKSLGVDRWLAMLAAYHHHTGTLLIIDCGTAITLDAIDPAGKHLGGLILPGVQALYNNLLSNTKISPIDLPNNLDISNPIKQLGQNTKECIISGALYAVSGMIERTYAQLKQPDSELKLLLTGGDAKQIAINLRCPYKIVPELVFMGMALLLD